MTTFLFLVGLAAVVAGVALIYIPAALITGGVGIAAGAVLLDAEHEG
jgi:hypothetical protein